MNKKRLFYFSLIAAFAIILVAGTALAADDGPLFGRNVSRTPHTMTGASQMSTFWLYVPAQMADGTFADPIEYYTGDNDQYGNTTIGELIYTREKVKPLIITYNDGMVEEEIEVLTGAGFGERDAFAALSLDDGATWKNYNLSDSALRSSFVLKDGHDYPGDVFKLVHAVEGKMVAVAWISRFCEAGAPLYAWPDEEVDALLGTYTELDHPVSVDGYEEDFQLYTDDLFGVAGNQKSVDYTMQGFPEVGEIPYGCVWVARGTLEPDADNEDLYDIIWRAPERLTSGRRDPHQINITSSPGAGFIIEWQEDPDGLRPGKGLGPGEGWSGAIANSKTDLWYTYIDLAHFDDVIDIDGEDFLLEPTPEQLYDLKAVEKPKIAVPFAMPVRLTDNNQCKEAKTLPGDDPDPITDLTILPYCYADFNENGTADLCAETVSWTNPGGTTLDVCVTEDGRPLTGRTASTRVRWAMKSYDSDADGIPDSAWVTMGAEKMKALGTVGDDCDPTTDPECTIYDIGKNMWYYTFEFDKPALVTQGLMLNSPAISPDTEEFFDPYDDPLTESVIYDTEIARRFNLMVNSPAAMQAEALDVEIDGTPGTAGILVYKEGILFQGGPADIFTRRIELQPICDVGEDGVYIEGDNCFNPQVENPFAYENVVCNAFGEDYELPGNSPEDDGEGWAFTDGSNPNYVNGLCLYPGVNLSGTTIVRCDEFDGENCAADFPFSTTYEEWFSEDSPIEIPKVLEWRQCDGIATIPDCVAGESNLDDPSWANPYDVSKGHRGFIDGDFVMFMYASAANWKANTTGNEAYQLYIRRSFDGGQTWTTLPTDYTHWSAMPADLEVTADGTTTYEWYGGYGEVDYTVDTFYDAGAFEQARNVSQLAGTRVTVLDPRYSPSGGMLKRDYSSLLCDDELDGIWENCLYTLSDAESETEAPYPEDIRHPEAFFATFETGDNSVVTEETGTVPLDMYYSRAYNFGDDWDEQDICADQDDIWYPNENVVCGEDPQFRWDWLENGDDLATEASVYGNPSGDRFYAVWNQELPIAEDIYTDMDSEFRRIFFNFTTDMFPTASIFTFNTIFLDQSEEDEITILGSGRDWDRKGEGPDIINQQWFDEETGAILCTEKDVKVCKDKDGDKQCDSGCLDVDPYNLVCDEDEAEIKYQCDLTIQIKAIDMEPGKKQINFRVQDNDNAWSDTSSIDIYIFEHLYQAFLPVTP